MHRSEIAVNKMLFRELWPIQFIGLKPDYQIIRPYHKEFKRKNPVN